MGLLLAFGPNAGPAFTSAATISGTLETGQTLTCSYTFTKARSRNVTCRWYSYFDAEGTDQVLIGTGDQFTLTGTEGGRYIRAIVTATSPAGTATSTSAMTAAVTSGESPAPPVITGNVVITGTADVGETLTASGYSFTGQDSVAIQWYSYATEPTGSPLTGTDEVELGTSTTQALTESEAGRWIVVVVTATNATGTAVTSDSVAMVGVDPYEPIAPAQYEVPAYDISGLTQVACNAGDDLQAKLNNLRPGQVLVMEAGATWTGNYTVPATYLDGSDKTPESITSSGTTATVATSAPHGLSSGDYAIISGCDQEDYNGRFQVTVTEASEFQYTMSGDPVDTATGSAVRWSKDWAYIISSQMANLPAEGERVSVSDAANMPKVQCATYVDGSGNVQSENGRNDNNTLKILGGVNKLRVCGLYITTQYAAQNGIEFAQVTIGSFGSSNGEEIVIDRCIVHGTETGKNRDGIVMGGWSKKIAVIGCDIDYFKGVSTESHGIHIFLTPGPTLIHNNRICACAINVFICANSNPPGVTRSPLPADITITKNLIEKRTEWDPADPSYVGTAYTCKNLIESKGSKRVLIRGNVIRNSWIRDQGGQGYFHQNEGGDGVWDVDIRDNVFYSFATAFNLANPFDYGRGFGWQRVRLQNNLFALPRVSSETVLLTGVGTGFGRYLKVKHNTYVTTIVPKSMWFFNNTSAQGPSGIEHVVVEDNIFRQGNNAVGLAGNSGIGDGSTSGRPCALVHMTDFDFNKNVSVGSSLSQYSTTYADWRNWRSGNTGGIWSNSNVGYVNTAFTELGHFALSGSSQFKNWATDGTDVGADISAIAAQINSYDNPFGA